MRTDHRSAREEGLLAAVMTEAAAAVALVLFLGMVAIWSAILTKPEPKHPTLTQWSKTR